MKHELPRNGLRSEFRDFTHFLIFCYFFDAPATIRCASANAYRDRRPMPKDASISIVLFVKVRAQTNVQISRNDRLNLSK